MPTYSYQRPVKVLVDDNTKYVEEHVSHFLNTFSQNAFNSMTQEKKERVYKMLMDHELLLVKIFGEGMAKSQMLWPKLLRDGVDNESTRNFKNWLEKQ